MLDTSLNLHIQQTKTATTNLDFYIKLNADFLMELAQEYLVHCGAKPKVTSAGPPKHLVKAIKLLENVTKQVLGDSSLKRFASAFAALAQDNFNQIIQDNQQKLGGLRADQH